MKNILFGFIAIGTFVLNPVINHAQIDRTKAPKPGPAPKITLGKFESFTLKNGLKVIIVENHKLPVVSYSLVMDNQPIVEGEKAGYVDIFGDLLSRGTTNRTKAQLDEEVDMIGADLVTYSSGVYMKSLKKHNTKLLEIMSDIILHPSFPQEEFDKVVKQTKDGLETVKTDAGAIAGNLTNKMAYGEGHPYSDVTSPTTIENVTLDDIKTYYQQNFMPNIGYLAIVGDITKKEMEPLIEKYFGGWAKGTPIKNKITTPTPPENPQITMFDRPGSKQSTLRFVYPINNTVGGADYLKLRLLNSILGGGATGRLFMNLREAHGYTYGAYSSISADEYSGLFRASADVRTEVTDSAIFEFISELNKIATAGVTEKELNSAKGELTGSFAIGLENSQTIANFAINIDRYKLPKNFYENYLTNLNAITVEDVNAAAAKYIMPFNYHLIVVGDRAAIETKILKYDTDKKINFLDAFGNPAAELKSVPDGVTLQTVIDGYLNGIGGKANIDKLKDVTFTGNINSQFGALEYKQVVKAPNKSYSLITMSGATVQLDIFDGTNGKTDGMQGGGPYSEDQLKDAKIDAAVIFETDLAGLGVKGKLLGIDLVAQRDAYKVEYEYPSGKKKYSWYNVKTGLKVKSSEMQEGQGGSMEVVTQFENYQDVSGVMFPFLIKTMFGDIVFSKIETNTGVKDDLFNTK